MFKKVCILASLSQQSAIEEAVEHYKSHEKHTKWLLQSS